MVNCSPYEYYDDVLGIQLCFLIKGSGEHQQSLSLIEYDALKKRIQKGSIIRLRHNAPGIPAMVRFDSLPQSWQDLLVRKFGEPRRMVSKSLFEMEYRREARFFDELCRLELPNGRRLNDHDLDKYTTNASVLTTVDRIYKRSKLTWEAVCRMADDLRAVRTRCQTMQ